MNMLLYLKLRGEMDINDNWENEEVQGNVQEPCLASTFARNSLDDKFKDHKDVENPFIPLYKT